MNESRHANSHQGICIYSFSVHNMARNESKKGRNELKGLKSVCSISRGLWSACPYTQPGPKGAPCSSLCVGRRLKGVVINGWALAVEGGQHSGSRTEIKQFLTSKPSSSLQWVWCCWEQEAEHQFLFGPSSTGDPPGSGHSQAQQQGLPAQCIHWLSC